jgi:hypothetical protein
MTQRLQISAEWKQRLPMLVAAAFAGVWIVLRAQLQSVTLDEADSYLGAVVPPWASHWYSTSGNHLLNSLLMRLLAWPFGISHLAMRAPALAGGFLYIVASYRICRMIGEQRWLSFLLFVCLVYNPFTMDYMVAARGYGLAVGFFMTGLYLFLRNVLAEESSADSLLRDGLWISLCAVLSFSANFSYAWANLGMLGAYLAFAWPLTEEKKKLLAKLLAPGLAVFILVDLTTVLRWPKGQLYYGAESLSVMLRSIQHSLFFELNEALVNPILLRILSKIQPWIIAAGALLLVAMIGTLLYRRTPPHSPRGRLLRASFLLLAIIVFTLVIHWLQFKLWKIPLPQERTALFFVPLAMLAFGLAAAASGGSRIAGRLRCAAVALLVISATYFAGCLRVMYFAEWNWDADVRSAFPVIEQVAQKSGIHDVAPVWQFRSPLNFYRLYYGQEGYFPLFTFTDPLLPGRPIYVLNELSYSDFIQKNNLVVIFRGSLSDLAIAVTPAVADAAGFKPVQR